MTDTAKLKAAALAAAPEAADKRTEDCECTSVDYCDACLCRMAGINLETGGE
ncbi:hypothetical protein [Cronobacter sakazakii]|uniref:hypothetical protein n=1 Tax=Cronobacter sakazakii TaxID=28141 RepID=UPI00131A0011|nr:hypothetical protein [Cronobacter sakazakii]